MESKQIEEPPPFGKSWNGWYAAVLLTLAILIVLFYIFTKTYQ